MQEKIIISKSDENSLLKLFLQLNSPEWLLQHSLRVALVAQKLFKNNNLDIQLGFTLGLFHDAGRIKYPIGMKHAYEGYLIFIESKPLIARICATHSFPTGHITDYQGLDNCSTYEKSILINQLNHVELFDKLIMLSDCYCTSDKFVTLNERFEDLDKRIKSVSNNLKVRTAYKLLEDLYGIDINNHDISNELNYNYTRLRRLL